jgi:hypothetical protein
VRRLLLGGVPGSGTASSLVQAPIQIAQVNRTGLCISFKNTLLFIMRCFFGCNTAPGERFLRFSTLSTVEKRYHDHRWAKFSLFFNLLDKKN